MLKRIAILMICAFSIMGYGQQKDSLTQKVQSVIADKFPFTRVLNLEYKQLTPYKTTLKSADGKYSEEFKVKQLEQFRFDGNFELFKRAQWVLSTSLHYQFSSFNGQTGIRKPLGINSFSGDYHYHNMGLNLTHYRRLFSKPAIFNASVSVDGSDKHFERVRGFLTGVLVLKHTAETTISLGVIAILERSVEIPVLPVFTLEQRFKNKWVLDVALPQRMYFKKQFLEHSRISIGSQLNKTSFYMYDTPKQSYEFRQLEINSGLIYERVFGKAIIGTLKGGIQNTFNSRIFEKQKSFKNFAVENTSKPSVYFSAGISFNPFYNR